MVVGFAGEAEFDEGIGVEVGHHFVDGVVMHKSKKLIIYLLNHLFLLFFFVLNHFLFFQFTMSFHILIFKVSEEFF